MTTPNGDPCRFRSQRRAPEGSPGTRKAIAAPLDDLYGFDFPAVAVDPSVFEERLWEGKDVLARIWLLLEAADRTEALAAGARAEASRAAEVAQAYLFLTDRLRVLAAAVPGGDPSDDELVGLGDRTPDLPLGECARPPRDRPATDR